MHGLSLVQLIEHTKFTIYRFYIVANLEQQFSILREQLYREKINQVDAQLTEVRGGRSQEYLAPLQRLNENMRIRTEVAGILKNYRIENINHKFYSEQMAAKQHFDSEKILAMDAVHEELMDKIRRLEEDRHNVDISWADWGTNTKTSKVRGPGRKKAVTVFGPYIVYMLNDDDIMEDVKTVNTSREHCGVIIRGPPTVWKMTPYNEICLPK